MVNTNYTASIAIPSHILVSAVSDKVHQLEKEKLMLYIRPKPVH